MKNEVNTRDKGINRECLDVTAKSKTQLADEYGISIRTFANWLKSKEIETGRRKILTSKEVVVVYNSFGVPRKDVPIRRVVR